MRPTKTILLSTTVVPFVVVAGVAVGGAVVTGQLTLSPAYAACNPCNPCNPCAAAQAGNPCSPCNPCAVKKTGSPCNPCAAAACNPCAAAKAGNSCSPCNPCAVKKTGNPCNPCNPCAAAKAGNPCNPCNPCAAGGEVELTRAEAVAAYDCLIEDMKAAYAKSDNAVALTYANWRRYSSQAYPSATHGNRYVQNYANRQAEDYGKYEDAGRFSPGARLAKDSFTVAANGAVAPGPLFVMEKMWAGFNPESDDWRYTMIMPSGQVFGTTKGTGSQKVEFCIGCHISVAPEMDSTMLLPEAYRVR